jgi:hypothetical protein
MDNPPYRDSEDLAAATVAGKKFKVLEKNTCPRAS